MCFTWSRIAHCCSFFFLMPIPKLLAIFLSVDFKISSMPTITMGTFTNQCVITCGLTTLFCCSCPAVVLLGTCTCTKRPTVFISPTFCNNVDVNASILWKWEYYQTRYKCVILQNNIMHYNSIQLFWKGYLLTW